MNKVAEHVFHVLSLPRRTEGRAEARGTIRAGTVEAGDKLWFVTPEGRRHELEVISVKLGERHVNLELQGSADGLESLSGGFYLYG